MTTTPEVASRLPDRVELLYTLAEAGRDAMAAAAAEMGLSYQPRPTEADEVDEPPAEVAVGPSPAIERPAPTPVAIELAPVRYWRPVAREYREALDGSLYPRAEPSTDEAIELDDLKPGGRAPRHEPIVAWPQLWRALEDRLRTPRARRAIDVERLVRCWARGEAIRTIPRRTGMAHASVTVVLDRSNRLMPFWRDQQRLLARLARRLGRQSVRFVVAGRLLEGRMPQLAADERVLALTDLGGFASSTTRAAWIALGARLARRGFASPLALVTAPSARWPRGVERHWQVVEWESPNRRRPPRSTEGRADPLTSVLPCLAMAQRLEIGLVRAIRRRLGVGLDAEVALWRHTDVVESNPSSLMLDPIAAKHWRREFSRLPPTLQAAVVRLLEAWHQEMPEVFAAEVAGVLASGAGPEVVDESTAERAIGLVARICRRVARDRDDDPQLDREVDGYFGRLGQWASLDFWRASRLRADLDRAVQAHRRRYPDAELPTDMTPDSLAVPERRESAVERWQVAQRGEGLTVEQGGRGGSPVAEITARDAPVVADGLGPAGAPTPGVGRLAVITAAIHVTSDIESVILEPWQPILDDATSWASAAGRDEYGLWAAFEVEGVRQRMRWIPPGRFWMGSPTHEEGRFSAEGPRHPVALAEGFWLADTPCTQELWRAVMQHNPSQHEGNRFPVETVSWLDCQLFFDCLNERFRHLDARLPSEAEWEYACRAGTETATWLGDTQMSGADSQSILDGIAWYEHNSITMNEVGMSAPNPWGLFDILGNIREWCWDWKGDYASGARSDPEGPSQGTRRILRSSSWRDHARFVRAACRSWTRPERRRADLGFRLSRGTLRGTNSEHQAARRGTSQRAGLRRSRAWIERLGWAHDGGTDAFGRWASFTVDGVETRLRWMVPGTFWMGSPEDEAGRWSTEGPRHEVTLTEGFWIGETPCTQALWEAVTGSNPSRFRSSRRPVEQVSWDDVQEFLAALGQRVPGLEPRLPTEAWWEYACRAGTSTATWRGDLEILGERNAPLLDEIAWYGGNSGVGFDLLEGQNAMDWKEVQYPRRLAGTREVALKRPNPWGLYDMLGNVYEWCNDRWASAYPEGPRADPTGPEQGPGRVLRGGSWIGLARDVRAAYRLWFHPGVRRPYLGFRLSRGRGS